MPALNRTHHNWQRREGSTVPTKDILIQLKDGTTARPGNEKNKDMRELKEPRPRESLHDPNGKQI